MTLSERFRFPSVAQSNDDGGVSGQNVNNQALESFLDRLATCIVGIDARLAALEVGGTAGNPIESFIVACSDEPSALASTGTAVTFRMPYAFTVTDVRASLGSAASTGTFQVDINENAVSILSTKLTIDANETTSQFANTQPVISDTSLAEDSIITIDIDDTADNTATGLKVTIIGRRA